MKKFKDIGKKVLGTFFALMLVSSLVFSNSASAANTIKQMTVNEMKGAAQVTKETRRAVWSTVFSSSSVKCTVSGTYKYIRTESGSVSNGSVSPQSATTKVSIIKNLSSGYVFSSVSGTHKAVSGGDSATAKTSV